MNDFPAVTVGVATLLRPYAKRVAVEQFVGGIPSRGRFDVLLFDVFGHPDPMDRLTQMINGTGSAVLVFSWCETQEQIDGAIGLGAAGFLAKTVDGEKIVTAVEAAAAGRPVRSVPAPRSEAMACWPGQRQGLTSRESEVLSLIVSGLSNQAIARRICLSPSSVQSCIRAVYRKANVTSRSEAVLWGIQHGLQIKPVGPA